MGIVGERENGRKRGRGNGGRKEAREGMEKGNGEREKEGRRKGERMKEGRRKGEFASVKIADLLVDLRVCVYLSICLVSVPPLYYTLNL